MTWHRMFAWPYLACCQMKKKVESQNLYCPPLMFASLKLTRHLCRACEQPIAFSWYSQLDILSIRESQFNLSPLIRFNFSNNNHIDFISLLCPGNRMIDWLSDCLWWFWFDGITARQSMFDLSVSRTIATLNCVVAEHALNVVYHFQILRMHESNRNARTLPFWPHKFYILLAFSPKILLNYGRIFWLRMTFDARKCPMYQCTMCICACWQLTRAHTHCIRTEKFSWRCTF